MIDTADVETRETLETPAGSVKLSEEKRREITDKIDGIKYQLAQLLNVNPPEPDRVRELNGKKAELERRLDGGEEFQSETTRSFEGEAETEPEKRGGGNLVCISKNKKKKKKSRRGRKIPPYHEPSLDIRSAGGARPRDFEDL